MYLIIGLGNPEEEYARTRHNMGFDTINKISEKYNIKVNKNKFNSLYGTGTIEGKKVILLKPQTYMNLSGTALRDFMNFYKLSSKDIIVIYDDLDIQPGIIKIRKKNRRAYGDSSLTAAVRLLAREATTSPAYVRW